MKSTWRLVLAAAATTASLLPAAAFARQQGAVVITEPSEPVVIVPQGRHVVIWPNPRQRPAQPVRLTAVNTSVSITDQVATTTMVLTLTNPGGGQQEAQMLVPVPEGASIRSFGLDSLGSEPTAKLLPRDEARRIYNSIVAKARDPGLLEFVGYSLIKSSVFPVPPGGSQTVRLTYEQLLSADGTDKSDRIDYVLPRSESLEATGVNWSFSADIRSKRPISTVYSPSHEIMTERLDPNHITVKLMTGSLAQPGAFRISYLLPRAADEITASVLLYPDPELGGGQGGYFLLLTGLPAKAPEEARAIRREVTIVLDRSGSMRGQKIEQAREAVLQVVEGLKPGEFFNIIDYSDSIASFSEKPVAKTDETISKARSYIKSIQPGGGTNISDAVIEALRQEPAPGTLPVVLFLTDGLPTIGQTSEVAIREAAAKANRFERRIFTFGVGFDVNAPLLRGLSTGSRAASTFVLPDENVEVKVGQVFRKLSGPIFSSPRLAVPGDDGAVQTKPIRELQPASLPDLFDGDQLIVLGQYTDARERKLLLEGNFFGKQRTFEFTFDPARSTTRNSFIPRLWASRKIATLIEQIRQNSAGAAADPASDPRTKELVDEIVRLSTKWGILTEYTAFLAVEPGVFAGGDIPRLELQDALRAQPGAGGGQSAFRSGNFDVLTNAPAEVREPSAPARAKAGYVFNERAAKERDGKVAINQELNLGRMTAQTFENRSNEFLDKDLNRIQINTICQVNDQTLFLRKSRWIDARILDKEAEKPDRVIEFASDDYYTIVDELAALGRQGLLAQGGDCLLLHKGQRVLIKAPPAE
jgi:Ca-activated chloride channel family protein